MSAATAPTFSEDQTPMTRKDELQILVSVEDMLKDADKKYDDAARMHFDGKCSFESGRRAALRAVLQLFETV